MLQSLTPLQREVLLEVASWADRYSCMAAVYIFGSIARGDERPESDLDLALEYDEELYPARRLVRSVEMVTSFGECQSQTEEWALDFGQRIGHIVHIHRGHPDDEEDAAWPVIQAAAKSRHPIVGKAHLVATPKMHER